MKFIDEKSNDDLKPGYTTYVLKAEADSVKFMAYKGEYALGAYSKEARESKANDAKYFLRKGFELTLECIDSKVMTPMFEDNEGRAVVPHSREEMKRLIYEDKLNVVGFKFSKTATDEQKTDALRNLINGFVYTSQGIDFESDKKLFKVVNADGKTVSYSGGGLSNVKISGAEVQEKLGMNTPDVAFLQMRRRAFLQNKIKHV